MAAAAAAMAPVPVLAQAKGPSAVIDVTRARAEPIPIAIPELGGADGAAGQLGRELRDGEFGENLTTTGIDWNAIDMPLNRILFQHDPNITVRELQGEELARVSKHIRFSLFGYSTTLRRLPVHRKGIRHGL